MHRIYNGKILFKNFVLQKKFIIYSFLVVFFAISYPFKNISSTSISINWKLPISNFAYRDPVIDDNGNIYLLNEDGIFYAVSNKGQLLYTLSISRLKQKPSSYSDLILSDDGIIYFMVVNLKESSNNYDLDEFKCFCYEIDITNREIKNCWEVKYDNPEAFPVTNIPYMLNERLPCSPTIDNDNTVYFGAYDSKIYVFSGNNDIKTGYRVNSVGKVFSILNSSFKNNQSLIYLTNDLHSGSRFYLHARSLEGALLFTTEPISSPSPFHDHLSEMVMDENGLIYFICSSSTSKNNQGYAFVDSNLYIFDLFTPLQEIGNDSFLPMKPKLVVPIKGFSTNNSIVIGANNELFISGEEGIYSFDLRGKINQIYPCKNHFYPVLDKQNNIYLGIDKNSDAIVDTISCITKNGILKWEYPMNLKAGLMLDLNNNIICADNDYLYSLSSSSSGLLSSAWPTYLHDNKHTNRVFIKEKKVITIDTTIILKIGSRTAYIDNRKKTLDAAPYISSNRTMVPFRFIAEAIDAEVKYNTDPISKEVTQVIYIKNSITIILKIGSNYAIVNNKNIRIDAAPQIVNGRTFVPVRFVSEQLGGKVSWEAKTQEIKLVFTTHVD